MLANPIVVFLEPDLHTYKLNASLLLVEPATEIK